VERAPRILFIADRNILANQAINDFDQFPEDAMCRVTPKELRKNNYKVPTARNLYFTIFQTMMTSPYVMDVDFDGENDIVKIKDCEVKVYRYNPTTWRSKNVSKQVPYCFLAAHMCCDAHKAFTTFNYSTKTIYIEAHLGSGDINTSIRQFQKVGEEWKEVIPVTPSYIINKDLYPPKTSASLARIWRSGKSLVLLQKNNERIWK
jgi:hypothetical protein